MDVNSFPKQLVKVIPLYLAGHLLSPYSYYIGFMTTMFHSVGKVPVVMMSLDILSKKGIRQHGPYLIISF